MSCKLLASAWKSCLPPREKLVLMGFADQACDDGLTAPDLYRLAAVSSVSIDELTQIIHGLMDGGYLVRTEQVHAGWYLFQMKQEMLPMAKRG